VFDEIGRPLFAALAKAATAKLSETDPCTLACLKAATSGAHADMLGAQASLMELTESTREAVMAEAHRLLREDVGQLFRDVSGTTRPPMTH
jgi:hypothetical protein